MCWHEQPARHASRRSGSQLCSWSHLLSSRSSSHALSMQVSGHGNFGSLDNDPPAAMRYTECRLQSVSSAVLLADLEYDTVDFAPNFDGSQVCPASVLSSAHPKNWLINDNQCLHLDTKAFEMPATIFFTAPLHL